MNQSIRPTLVFWGSLGLLIFLTLSGSGIVIGQSSGANFDFKGRLLVAVSDADMVASAYQDGRLGPVAGNDALSVIRLDKPVRELKAVAIEATNSVTGPPSSVAVSPDGRYAIVIETRGGRPSGKANPVMADLGLGKAITVIDLSDPDHPRQVQRIDGTERPQSVDFNADGSLVVIATYPLNPAQSPLALYRFAGGKLTDLVMPALSGWATGERLNGAFFHPNQHTLAILNATKPSLSFMKVISANGTLSLTGWGNTVLVDKQPFKVVFTPDGRYVVLNAMYYGEDVSATATVPSTVLSVQLSAVTAPDGSPRHQIVDRVISGVYSEGLTISPDGRWLATTNLEQSAFAPDDPRQGFFASISLIRIDPQSGLLDRVGTYAFDGILPESVVFDNTSRYLAVTTFDHYDGRKPAGSIDFWRLAGDYFDPKRIELVKTDYSVPVTRGVHSMVIVR